MSRDGKARSRWMREHASLAWRRSGRVKIRHDSRESALEHADKLRIEAGDLVEAYACRWTDDHREGEVAEEHWHVGRPLLISRPHLRKGLCGNRADHQAHVHQSASLGPFWCTANERHREPARSQRRVDWEMAR